jgi:hypothetical protein
METAETETANCDVFAWVGAQILRLVTASQLASSAVMAKLATREHASGLSLLGLGDLPKGRGQEGYSLAVLSRRS